MTLRIEPNPVPRGTQAATVRVTWDSGDKRGGEVRVVRDDGVEVVFAAGSSGTEEASWIAPGATYEFRLYRPRRAKAVASVTVSMEGTAAVSRPLVRPPRRGRPFLRASPNPVAVDATAGRTRLIWDTGNGSNGVVTVATQRRTPREDEVLVASGPNGDQEIDWIRRDVLYRFRLYRESTDRKPVAEARVTMGFERLELLADIAVLAALTLPPLLIVLAAAIVTRRVARIVRAAPRWSPGRRWVSTRRV